MKAKVRRQFRFLVRPDSLLSEDETILALPGPADASVRRWLRERVRPFGSVAGVVVYRWADVVSAVESTQQTPQEKRWLTTAEAARHLGIARSTLDEMLANSRPHHPGTPSIVGTGKQRTHRRWDRDALDDWFASSCSSPHARRPEQPSEARPRKGSRSLLAQIQEKR